MTRQWSTKLVALREQAERVIADAKRKNEEYALSRGKGRYTLRHLMPIPVMVVDVDVLCFLLQDFGSSGMVSEISIDGVNQVACNLVITLVDRYNNNTYIHGTHLSRPKRRYGDKLKSKYIVSSVYFQKK
jgi:hypothetical protein